MTDNNTEQTLQAITPGSTWRHASGRQYVVLLVANEHAERKTDYPLTVVYQGEDGRVWSRLASAWHRSMAPVALSTEARELPTGPVVVDKSMLAKAIDVLEEARDNVSVALAHAESLRGYPRTDRMHAELVEQLRRHDAVTAELKEALPAR